MRPSSCNARTMARSYRSNFVRKSSCMRACPEGSAAYYCAIIVVLHGFCHFRPGPDQILQCFTALAVYATGFHFTTSHRSSFMKIGVPKEVKIHECRVGLVPAGVRELVDGGHQVLVQTGAGAGIGFEDAHYLAAGAKVATTAADVFSAS